MKIKKMLNNTVGVTIGAVGISEANKIQPFGETLGTTLSAGMLSNQLNKKKKGGL